MKNKKTWAALAVLALAVTSCSAGTAWLVTKHAEKEGGVVKSDNKSFLANISPIKFTDGGLGLTLAPERGLATAPVFGRAYKQEIAGPGISDKVSSWLATTGSPYEMSDTELSSFQLGLWEIVSGDTNLSLSEGNFSVVNVNPIVVSQTESWLSQYSFQEYSYQYTLLTHPGKDNIVVIPSIPEPSTWVLLLGGLLGLFLLYKRKHERRSRRSKRA